MKMIESQKMISSAKARVGFFMPKKIMLQRMFRTKLIAKTTTSLGFCFLLDDVQDK